MRKTYRPKFKKPTTPQYRINRGILVPEVRLVGAKGENVGVVSTADALLMAEAADLDLVEVSPLAQPPVAKILDFSQFKYKQEKEIQRQKVKQKKQEMKGIRLSLRIGQHDQNVRLEHACRFLEDGDKLKIELILRGREHQHQDLATKVIQEFVKALQLRYKLTVEQGITKQGGRLSFICYSNGKVGSPEPVATN